jgi:flagellar basal-body rod protein FlgF
MRCSVRDSMIQGIYQSAAAADGLKTWNDVIARNIAASGTPAFKKDVVLFDGVFSGMMSYGAGDTKQLAQPAILPTVGGGVNFSTGETHRTGDPQEFAIEGRGFFRLQRPDGQFVYTRDGQFHVAADGRLQSKQGYLVVGDSGPIQLLTEGGPMTVDAEGRVRQGDQQVGSFTIFDFQNLGALQRTNGGFAVDKAQRQGPQTVEGARIQQGFLEMSNVSPMHEMVELITVSNALQANQRVLQNFDGMLDRAIQVLGNAS